MPIDLPANLSSLRFPKLPISPSPLPMFGAVVAGPALLITAVMAGDKLSTFSRMTLGLIGVATIGVSVKAMQQEKELGGTDLMRNLLIGMDVERSSTADPLAAMQLALNHLKERPDYYDQVRASGC